MYTYEQLKGAGWNDDQIRANYPTIQIPAAAAPAIPPAPPAAPAAPAMPMMPAAGGHNFSQPGFGGAMMPPGSTPMMAAPVDSVGLDSADPWASMDQDAGDLEFSDNRYKFERCVIRNGTIVIRCMNYQRLRQHWVICDDGKPRPFICGRVSEDYYSLIETLVEPLIGDGTFDYVVDTSVQVAQGQRQRKKRQYKFRHLDPSLFAEILGEMTTNGNSWRAKDVFLFNVIDRNNSWCTQYRHTLVLCKNEKGMGIGPTLYQDIVQARKVYQTNLQELDLAITRSGSGRETKYSVTLGPNLDARRALTEEEKVYGGYDLLKMSEPSSEEWIIKNLGAKMMHVIRFVETHQNILPVAKAQEWMAFYAQVKGRIQALNPVVVAGDASAGALSQPAIPPVAPSQMAVQPPPAPAQATAPVPPVQSVPVAPVAPPPVQVAPPPPVQAAPPPPVQAAPPPPIQAAPPPPVQAIVPPPPGGAVPPPRPNAPATSIDDQINRAMAGGRVVNAAADPRTICKSCGTPVNLSSDTSCPGCGIPLAEQFSDEDEGEGAF
jgi:hypothetical protein